jgi:RNA polymerase sigma factor (sigma-70 family)
MLPSYQFIYSLYSIMLTSQDAPKSSQLHTLDHLLHRLQQGDRQAQGDLIRYTQSRLRLHVHNMLKRFPAVQKQENTSDVLQNVWIRIQRTLENLTITSGLDLLRLSALHIRYELIDLARQHSARPLTFSGQLHAPDPAASPVDVAYWQEIHQHLSQLPAEERDLFDLLYYQGLTKEQTASLLKLSLSTLKRRWIAARENLGRWLQVGPSTQN